jgi:hypothetical protein
VDLSMIIAEDLDAHDDDDDDDDGYGGYVHEYEEGEETGEPSQVASDPGERKDNEDEEEAYADDFGDGDGDGDGKNDDDADAGDSDADGKRRSGKLRAKAKSSKGPGDADRLSVASSKYSSKKSSTNSNANSGNLSEGAKALLEARNAAITAANTFMNSSSDHGSDSAAPDAFLQLVPPNDEETVTGVEFEPFMPCRVLALHSNRSRDTIVFRVLVDPVPGPDQLESELPDPKTVAERVTSASQVKDIVSTEMEPIAIIAEFASDPERSVDLWSTRAAIIKLFRQVDEAGSGKRSG